MTTTSARIRTRFAPSPTGFIHLGNIRSALYPWAFARNQGGDFILRIEDTDTERSSQEAVDVILEGMQWLGMDIDEGPIYQTDRLTRYQEVLQIFLDKGLAYPCYMNQAQLDQLREKQLANGENPKYDGTWRPEVGKTLPPIPEGIKPAIRFKNPTEGVVTWIDSVKGEISFHNKDLDDLIIARSDGMPTYNFCVVVDDLDMQITHVIRGDDHVNNTPRQINMIQALGATPPIYAHLPTILDSHGEKMSKRNGAMSVRDYQEAGYLPDAVINYLARLGWSHGDDEIFSREQFIKWFNLDHLGKSAAQFNLEKLNWLNSHYLANTDSRQLAKLLTPFLLKHEVSFKDEETLLAAITLYQTRVTTLDELAKEIKYLTLDQIQPATELLQPLLNDAIGLALVDFRTQLSEIDWNKESIHHLIKSTLDKHQLKMPQLAMPLRLLVAGQKNTPAIDAVLYLVGKERTLERLNTI